MRFEADDARVTHVLAVGKAAPLMTQAFTSRAVGPVEGLIIVPGTPATEISDVPFPVIRGAHPVPDERSERAGRAAFELVAHVPATGTLLVLLSGGASALMVLPAPGLSLQDKQATTRRLLAAGADIHAINCVRKHLSRVKGGRLGAACPGRVVTLAISDVVGDDPSVIGSGPTAPDPTTFRDALAVLDACGGRRAFPASAVDLLERGARGQVPETPKPGDPFVTARSATHVVGSRVDAISGAAAAARRLNYRVITADDPIVGEAHVRGADHVQWVASIADRCAESLCILSAGETTVRVQGRGKGGRNQEFVLSAVGGLAQIARPVVFASIGTDGVDGPTDAAGAIADSSTAARARGAGLDPMQYLEANDAWTFFEALGDLVRTGPTGTNVGDLQVALIGQPAR
jgi:glycerate 2-kinase